MITKRAGEPCAGYLRYPSRKRSRMRHGASTGLSPIASDHGIGKDGEDGVDIHDRKGSKQIVGGTDPRKHIRSDVWVHTMQPPQLTRPCSRSTYPLYR